jgi:hypothetical protein
VVELPHPEDAGITLQHSTSGPGIIRADDPAAAGSSARFLHRRQQRLRHPPAPRRRKEASVDAPPHARARHSREHVASRAEYDELPTSRVLEVGIASGILGGLALAVPIVIWDWARSSHRALELPMAATAWLFGLGHFSHVENLWWPIVLGTALLVVYWAVSGVLFVALADRLYRLSHPAWTDAAGVAWSFVSFMFFWYMLLPIARDGAPFRASAVDPMLFTAPNWVWILGFTLSGLAIVGCSAALRRSPAIAHEQRRTDRFDERRTHLHHPA